MFFSFLRAAYHDPSIRLLLGAHIATGSIALLVGLVPMIGRKGEWLHVRAGPICTYSMMVVAFSAVLFCLLQPLTFVFDWYSYPQLLSELYWLAGRPAPQHHLVRYRCCC